MQVEQHHDDADALHDVHVERNALEAAEVHDLHIWGMSTTETALTCHLVMPAGHPGDAALGHIARDLEERFGVHHATIQIEIGDSDEVCALTPETVV